MNPVPETYAARLRKYERREQLTIWVVAGLGTLVGLVGIDELRKAPEIFGPLLITIAILGGLCLAFARVKFEWRATCIRRDLADQTIQNTTPLSASDEQWPKDAELFWLLCLSAIVVGWFLLLVGVWWSPIQNLWHGLYPSSASITHGSLTNHQTVRLKTVTFEIEGLTRNSHITLATETDAESLCPVKIVVSDE